MHPGLESGVPSARGGGGGGGGASGVPPNIVTIIIIYFAIQRNSHCKQA